MKIGWGQAVGAAIGYYYYYYPLYLHFFRAHTLSRWAPFLFFLRFSFFGKLAGGAPTATYEYWQLAIAEANYGDVYKWTNI